MQRDKSTDTGPTINMPDHSVIDIRDEKYASSANSKPPSADKATRPETADETDTETVGRNASKPVPTRPREHGGPSGPEPTRYGDWERNGRCSDF